MSGWKSMGELPMDGRKIIVLKRLGIKEGFTLEVLKEFDSSFGGYSDLLRNGSPNLWRDYDPDFFDKILEI